MIPSHQWLTYSNHQGVKGHSRWYDAYPNLLKLLDVLFVLPVALRESLSDVFIAQLASGLQLDEAHLQEVFKNQQRDAGKGHSRWYDSTPTLRLLLATAEWVTPMQLQVYVDAWLQRAYDACDGLVVFSASTPSPIVE
jgi:hypothetical protein